ncbi:MAG TPA: YoaK family protein [Kofleriaceae bacterium]|nr:YoaK family protein [Kofleriaceae bacterium]
MAEQPTAWRMAVLGWIAGAVDAVGYRLLGQIYISNMTGNTSGIAIAITGGQLPRAIERGYALVAFLAGVFVGTALAVERPARPPRSPRPRDPSPRLLGAELALVAATSAAIRALAPHGGPLAGSEWRFYVIAALAAVSMGIQNSAFMTPHHDGPYTTHITGALTSLVHGITRRVLGRGKPQVRQHAGLCAGFLLGGFSAMLAFDASPFAASVLPIPVLAVLLERRIHRARCAGGGPPPVTRSG